MAAAEAQARVKDEEATAVLTQIADPAPCGGVATQDSAKQAGEEGCSGPANTVGKVPVENKKVDRGPAITVGQRPVESGKGRPQTLPSKASVQEPAKKVSLSCKKRPAQRVKSQKEQREAQARRKKRALSGCYLDSEESLYMSDGEHTDEDSQ